MFACTVINNVKTYDNSSYSECIVLVIVIINTDIIVLSFIRVNIYTYTIQLLQTNEKPSLPSRISLRIRATLTLQHIKYLVSRVYNTYIRNLVRDEGKRGRVTIIARSTFLLPSRGKKE